MTTSLPTTTADFGSPEAMTAVQSRVAAMNADGLTWGTFWNWFITNFPQSYDTDFVWYAQAATGADSYRGTLAAWAPPDPTKITIHDHHELPLQAAMARQFVAPATWDTTWGNALDALLRLADNSRTDDTDDGLTNPYKIYAMVDALRGSNYLQSPHAKEIYAVIQQDLRKARGGVWLVSTDYDVGDVFFLCEIAHLCGVDHWPELLPFLEDHTRYLVWATTSDLLAIEEHGDVGAPAHDPKWHYRLNLLCMLTSVLPDCPERTLAMKLIRTKLSTEAERTPQAAYAYRFNLPALLYYFDPRTLGTEAMTDADWPTGIFGDNARGLVIYRDGSNFLTFDSRVASGVDHDQMGGQGSWEWYRKQPDGTWKWLNRCPGGYEAGAAMFNCATVGGQDTIWGWTRTYLGANAIDGGFEAACEMRGPWTRPGTFGPTYQYLDRFRTTLRFDGNFAQVRYEWITRDGQPVVDATRPMLEARLWNLDGATFKAAGSLATGPEAVPTYFGQSELRWTLASTKPSGVLTINLGPGDVPQPAEAEVSFPPEPISEPPVITPPPVVNPPPPNNPPPPVALAWPTGTISFDGTAGRQVPDFGDLSSVSFATWFKADKTGPILSQDDGANPPGGHCPALLIDPDGKLRSSMFWHGATTAQIVGPVVNDGKWHHAAVTYGDGAESLYVDGVLTGQQTVPQTSYAAAYRYWLGAGYMTGWGGDGWAYFTGQLRDPKAESRCWTAAEVAALAKPDDSLPFRVEYRRFSDRIERVEIIPLAP